MPAKNSIKSYTEDAYYHLYNRGVNKRSVVKDQQDISTFLSYLKTYLLPKNIEKLNNILSNAVSSSKEKDDALRLLHLNNFHERIDLLAYCLMPNHFHLIVHQKNANDIDVFMQSFITRYTMYFNRRHGRVGSLFQGRYKAVLVDTDEQLLYLTRYIHRNPLSLDLKRSDLKRSDLFQMQPSSYGVYLGTMKQEWVKPDEVLTFFSGSKSGYNSYQSFVEDNDMDHESRAAVLISKEAIDMDLI